MINVVKAVQDKVASDSGSRTMQHQILEGPLNCLSVNRECSQVVVAGRNVFKVFNIEEDSFIEKCNLRVGKNLNLNFSASDVMWNPVEDHILASAATNGAVVIWNLNKTSRSKQETVFLEHKRTVHKVCFHGNEPHLLMSGAQDGLMMLFDLRKKGVASIFNGRSECVRDVQFSPHHYFIFGSAFENGNIQLWDMRNPQRAEKQFTAHNGPAFSIDWHPQERYWLGTAGRDKLIKVWDTQNISPIRSIHSVQTIASVARIKWRPHRQFHIASCALLVDFAINVWDVRRPYIPFASFNEHLDVVTGIVWKQNDPHIFLSSSRDSTLYQHVFRDATRPADNANPVSVDISTTGNVAHASCDKLAATPTGRLAFKIPQITPINIFRQRPPDRTEQFTTVCSTLSEFETDSLNEALSLDWFVESALGYKLTGRPISELCEQNARVAQGLNRLQVAQTWNMLKLLYTPAAPTAASQGSIGAMGGKTPDLKENNTEWGKLTVCSKQHHDSKSSKIMDPEIKEVHGDISTGVSDEDSDVPENDVLLDTNLSHIASGMGNDNHSDFFFGDGDVDQTSFEYDNLENLQNARDWELPNEAFQLRHEIGERGTLPEPLAQKAQDSPSSANESDYGIVVEKVNRNVEKNIREDILAIKPFISTVTTMDFVELIVDMLKQYAEKSDIQMAVTALIVLDDKIRPHIDDSTQEQWFTSYIDLLGRFKLWTIATAIIKLSKLSAVSDLNQRSTRIQTNCSKCMKPLLRTGWLCDRCKSINICSICHLPVKGVYVWCQGCSHGGHLQHIQEWLLQCKQCPAGCGHLCEYTQQDSYSSSTMRSIKQRGSYPQLTRWT